MALEVIGLGWPRTGTYSLRAVLQEVVGPTYHMVDLLRNVDQVGAWRHALRAQSCERLTFLSDYRAVLDWPSSLLWREWLDHAPDAKVILTVRANSDVWFSSANATVFGSARVRPLPHMREWWQLWNECLEQAIGTPWDQKELAKRRYEQHIAEVVDVCAHRDLLVWDPEQGSGPLAEFLGVHEVHLAHLNTREEWARKGYGAYRRGVVVDRGD